MPEEKKTIGEETRDLYKRVFFSTGLSISHRGWTYEVSQCANLPISHLSSFLGTPFRSSEGQGNCGDTGGWKKRGLGEVKKEGMKRRHEREKWVKAAQGRRGRGQRLPRFPSNFSNLIKSCSA